MMATDPPLACTLDHAHLFASEVDASIRFYREMFGAEVVLDAEIAGARTVRLRLGSAYLNLYDQPPRDAGRGAVHHLGIHTENLERLVAHMRARGFAFRKGISDAGAVRYVMAAAPDGVLLELFETP